MLTLSNAALQRVITVFPEFEDMIKKVASSRASTMAKKDVVERADAKLQADSQPADNADVDAAPTADFEAPATPSPSAASVPRAKKKSPPASLELPKQALPSLPSLLPLPSATSGQ